MDSTIRFRSSEETQLDSYIELYANRKNKVFIRIGENDLDVEFKFVALDLKNAIKLSKVLRQQIAKIKEEVDNG